MGQWTIMRNSINKVTLLEWMNSREEKEKKKNNIEVNRNSKKKGRNQRKTEV